MHAAAVEGHVAIARYLVGKGLSVDLANKEKDTPLHIAAGGDSGEFVKFLMEEGKAASINWTDSGGYTSMHLAAWSGTYDIAKYLEGKGAFVNKADNNGNTPLHLFLKTALETQSMRPPSLPENAFKMVDFFVKEMEVDVNVQNKDGETPLHTAVRMSGVNGRLRAVGVRPANVGLAFATKLVKDGHADVNLQNKEEDDTPLHLAVKAGTENSLAMINYLVKKEGKAKLDIKNKDKKTPKELAEGLVKSESKKPKSEQNPVYKKMVGALNWKRHLPWKK